MRRRLVRIILPVGIVLGLALLTGCPFLPTPSGTTPPIYRNTTDRTNNGATYVGSEACMACHATFAAKHVLHGHAHKVTEVDEGAPTYPAGATRAGGFDPPQGRQWSDVAYVIGGHVRKARFVDVDGYVMTDGVDGINTQWNLDFPANGTAAGWVAYEASRDPNDPKPYNYSCFVCHTTGPVESDSTNPAFQDSRPGMSGTFAEPGIQCEACHGPGSGHVPAPAARDLFVDTQAATCKECHDRPFESDDDVIRASGGYIKHHEQWPELKASGGHAAFACTICHDPHTSTNYDRENAIINECVVCHTDTKMALHANGVFVRGDYTEVMGCESCHMPFASKSAAAATAAVVGAGGRMGDTRTHVFRINSADENYTAMFSTDGSEVVTDAQGRAAVTIDFVCLRCHNGIGNAVEFSLKEAAAIAPSIHSD